MGISYKRISADEGQLQRRVIDFSFRASLPNASDGLLGAKKGEDDAGRESGAGGEVEAEGWWLRPLQDTSGDEGTNATADALGKLS